MLKTSITCAAEVFVATSLLHREQPGREDFTIREIVDRAKAENLCGELRPGVQVHASTHCVANRPPNPLKHSMLYATGKSTRRLLRRGDDLSPGRNGKHWPELQEVPERYAGLIAEARERYARYDERPKSGEHPLLRLVGLGAEVWKGVSADGYVKALREGWE